MEIFWTFAVSKTKASNFIRKSLNLATLLFRYHEAPEQVIFSIKPRVIFLNVKIDALKSYMQDGSFYCCGTANSFTLS